MPNVLMPPGGDIHAWGWFDGSAVQMLYMSLLKWGNYVRGIERQNNTIVIRLGDPLKFDDDFTIVHLKPGKPEVYSFYRPPIWGY